MSTHLSKSNSEPSFDTCEIKEVELRDFIFSIWEGRWIILLSGIISAAISVWIALSIPNMYVSEALVAPANSEQRVGSSALVGQLGGLATLAGFNISSGDIDKTTLTIEVMKSRAFIDSFINKHNLIIPIMAAQSWNSDSGKLILDAQMYDSEKSAWIRKVKPPRKLKPSSQEIYERFMEFFKVYKDPKTNLVKISIEFYSPHLAKMWVDWLIEDINKEMKNRDLMEAEKSIIYLNSQLEQTRVSEMKSVLFQLIEEQTKTIMFAEIRDEYAFKTIDSAISPEIKSKPSRALICLLITIFGGMLGMLFSLIRFYFKNLKGLKK